MHRILFAAFIALHLLLGACDLIKPSKASAFLQIKTGETTPAEALQIMGEPDSRIAKELLGIQVQIWCYADAKHLYRLTIGGSNLIGAEPRVLVAEMSPKQEDVVE